MRSLTKLLTAVRDDERAAAMVEYTILVGIIAVAAIAAILLVGTWVSEQWNYLKDNLPPTPA
jgi:pilus assembly protein Flp/PilA